MLYKKEIVIWANDHKQMEDAARTAIAALRNTPGVYAFGTVYEELELEDAAGDEDICEAAEELTRHDKCPQCGSDNIANEGPSCKEFLEVTCHDCSHQWQEFNKE